MATRPNTGDSRRQRPVDLLEILQRQHREEMRWWLQPKSGDLLHDVIYLQKHAGRESNKAVGGIYARAAIVMGVAAIEAVTNDALATIHELLTDSIPSECVSEPPWRYFMGRSARRVARLLQSGSRLRKRDYVLEQIERVNGYVFERQLLKDVDRLVHFRNRIVHMNYQERPGKYQPVLSAGQMLPLAELAADSTRHYVETVRESFSEMKLPIRTIRPWHHFDRDAE